MGPGTWTTSGHFVVLWWQDGKVRINDPASTKETRLNGDIRTFRGQVKYYWWVDARKFNKEDDDVIVTYKTLNDVPSYYKDAVKKAVDKGALNGTGDGLNVSEDMCRVLTVLDRLGKLD